MAGQDEVEEAWGQAWSLCSEEEWPDRERVGEKQEGRRVYILWRKGGKAEGEEEEFGYTTEVIANGVRVAEEVAVFGRRVTQYADREYRRKMKWMKKRNAEPEGQPQG